MYKKACTHMLTELLNWNRNPKLWQQQKTLKTKAQKSNAIKSQQKKVLFI